MILVDTSIWADHLGRGDARLASLLEQDLVLMHPYVLGEIAMGSMRARDLVLARLASMTMTPVADPAELLSFVKRFELFGTGVGYIDAHLLASTLLAPGAKLWSRDKRLRYAAERLDVAAA